MASKIAILTTEATGLHLSWVFVVGVIAQIQILNDVITIVVVEVEISVLLFMTSLPHFSYHSGLTLANSGGWSNSVLSGVLGSSWRRRRRRERRGGRGAPEPRNTPKCTQRKRHNFTPVCSQRGTEAVAGCGDCRW